MQNSLWGRRRRLLTTGSHLCFLPRQSHTVVSEGTFSFASSWAQDMEDPAWLEIPGPYVNGHQILSQLTLRVSGGLAPFIMIHNLVRSWGWRCPVCAEILRARELSSAGRTRVGSPDLGGPAHLHGVGVRVDLRGGGTDRAACLQAADGATEHQTTECEDKVKQKALNCWMLLCLRLDTGMSLA